MNKIQIITSNCKFDYKIILVSLFSVFLGQCGNTLDSELFVLLGIVFSLISLPFFSMGSSIFFISMYLVSNRVLTYGGISILLGLMIVELILMQYKRCIKLPKCLIFVSWILIVLVMITSKFEVIRIFDAIKVSLMIVYFYNIFLLFNIRIVYFKIIKYTIAGVFLSVVISSLMNPNLLSEADRLSLNNGGGENVLGIVCGTLIIHMVSIMIVNKFKLSHFLTIMALLIISILTGSRSFLLIIIVGLLYIFLLRIKCLDIKKIIIFIGIIIITVIIGMILIENFETLNAFYTNMLYRISKYSNVDISNGRFDIWMQYISVFSNNKYILFFGGNNYLYYGIELVAHNMLLEQIASYGLIGSFVVVYQYRHVFKRIFKINTMKFSLFNDGTASLVSFLAASMVSHTLLGIPQTFLLYICVIASCSVNYKE